MTTTPPDPAQFAESSRADRLDSWKEIAVHLGRDVSTVQRWERREGMPVHRHVHERLGSVYAFRSELDAWWRDRNRRLSTEPALVTTSPAPSESRERPRARQEEEATPDRRLADVQPRRRLRIAALLSAATLVGVLAALGLSRERTTDRVQVQAPAPAEASELPRVAVVVFENGSGDPSLDYLSRLAADRIVGVLARIDRVEVVSQTVERASRLEGVAPVMARSGLSLVVTGAYYARGDGLEFHARIHEGPRGRLLHATEPVSGHRLAVGEALNDLEQRVAGAVSFHFDDYFGGLDIVSHAPTLETYQEYRAGLEVFSSDYARAQGHLERALESDQRFWLPLAIKYFAYRNVDDDGASESVLERLEDSLDRFTPAERLWVEFLRARWERRHAHALRILEDLERLVPGSIGVNYNIMQESIALNRPAHAVGAYAKLTNHPRSLRHSVATYRRNLHAEALHLLGDYNGELSSIRAAQQDAPGMFIFLNGEVRALAALGRIDEVMQVIDHSLSLAPTYGTAGGVMEHAARELLAHGHVEASRALAARAVGWHRSRHSQPAAPSARAQLGRVEYLAGNWAEAGQSFAAAPAQNPGAVDSTGYLGTIAARRGKAARARAISGELSRIQGRSRALACLYRARIAAILGEQQEAVDALREAFGHGGSYGILVHQIEDFASLRDYVPFADLLRPKG